MRFTFSLFTAVAIVGVAANAQAPQVSEQRRMEVEERSKIDKIRDRAFELRPRRRDEPLRYLNISDSELREIQVLSENYIPKVLMNIGPVVSGCSCEEGPQCTDQVYIVAEKLQHSVGLQLSRVRNVWQVGVVQQWWLKFDALRSKFMKMDYAKYESAMNDLFREFPACVGELVPIENTIASTPKAEAAK
jgi:hypothetical protein